MNFRNFPVMAFHGCDASLATEVVSGKIKFKPSANCYDWLGGGVYFWIGSFKRAQAWAQDKFVRGKIRSPDVICSILDLRNCLALTDFGKSDEVALAHSHLEALVRIAGLPMPLNTFYLRDLDRAVIDTVHFLRKQQGYSSFDTVLGAFEEGPPIFPGSRIRSKTHIQIAVRNTDDCILETFKLRC